MHALARNQHLSNEALSRVLTESYSMPRLQSALDYSDCECGLLSVAIAKNAASGVN